jgi:hypothetical protein
MSITLLKPVGTAGAESDNPLARPYEPAMSSGAVYAQEHRHVQEMQRERLRQAEAQRLRRAALRARRSIASRLLG